MPITLVSLSDLVDECASVYPVRVSSWGALSTSSEVRERPTSLPMAPVCWQVMIQHTLLRKPAFPVRAVSSASSFLHCEQFPAVSASSLLNRTGDSHWRLALETRTGDSHWRLALESRTGDVH
jgi:hypothetical protein